METMMMPYFHLALYMNELKLLAQHGAKAVEILEAFEGTLEDDYPPDNERCEHGEMLLYKVDKLTYKEQEVSLLVKLGCLEEGANIYKALLTMNPDNYRYYEGLQKCFGLYSENAKYPSDEFDRLDALHKSLSQ
ncbi:N-terminal acetyltransferase A complex auxiliary subunit NAA15-like isoform X1 [Durio zibethinus]|uniref:N-terminal acetyltransferase A complex auxiliary subunit NAA15-like isoform X1 n=1 Tax=Durio zibethinus TaxID=66656 RepID=A0A6P5YYR4_DURZI|nr:N-terminal acetyltransferase A complex auxiliary subunit NAA15-like isoform X1 [Durio zibethinus]XP_022745254.1 N-terminal acetyltransferase A complex auxiliary subunit NAA15-like isoform X1 [Durio zibethinus]XP_022745255.1 N-terminal acetyltransferase A complex auxiliary subunit NAA15-like isoform X1 [Durio zibethinus]XP_022745257.1 N-terminal acetyltransferase A complex auxiliary subunit NAA15-like isoform X1 [Durio zibethinus]XP_022745258.1 N-terminal acetyltransferase A complex auxiliary